MRILMNYGKQGLPLELPDDWDVTVIRKPAMPVLDEPKAAVKSALANPVGSKPLIEEARSRRSACVLICDITRPVPNSVLLPVLIRELIGAGIDPGRITVLVATGLHRPNEGEELRELVGDDWVLKTVRAENHFARRDKDHVLLGTTTRGTPVRLDRRFVEADMKIVTGLVEPHFMAGYSGGRKVMVPGISHQQTITTLHSARFLEDPRSANCIMEGNPFHEDQVEAARMIPGVLAVNVVVDELRRLSFVSFGALEASHLAAVSHMRGYAEIPVSRKFRTVVTSSAGYPLDKTYYQTVKGMVGAIGLLEPGGNLFIVSECSEGIGSQSYAVSQRRLIDLGPDKFLKEVLDRPCAQIDEWQTEMQLKPMRVGNVHLHTKGLSAADLALTGVRAVGSLDKELRDSVRESGDTKVAVIPEGPYVVPRVL